MGGSGPSFTLSDEVERKAFVLWGGDVNNSAHERRWFGLTPKSRRMWRNRIRDGVGE